MDGKASEGRMRNGENGRKENEKKVKKSDTKIVQITSENRWKVVENFENAVQKRGKMFEEYGEIVV